MDTFVNSIGCDSTVTTDLTVTMNSDFMALLTVTPPCPNLSDGTITIENVSGGTAPFSYFFDGVDVGTTTFFPNLAGGQTYIIIVQDALGCSFELSAFVEETPALILDLGEDQIVDLGETIIISPTYNFTPTAFNWESITPIECFNVLDCEDYEFLPTTSQQIILDLMVGVGCSVSDTIFIEVVDDRKVYLPNTFSPNGDGFNDFFTVFAKENSVQVVEEFLIFDRWGNLIFQNENFLPNELQNGWNGKFDGRELSPGVYVYTTTIRFADENVLRYSGDVTILK